MAEGASYPIRIENSDEQTSVGGALVFTDSSNEPAPPDTPPGAPFVAPDAGSVTVIVAEDASPLAVYSADDGQLQLAGGIVTSQPSSFTGNSTFTDDLTVDGELNPGSLGPAPVYVTVQGAAPTTYLTPLVLDNTMTTGGLYAWDGSAYQKVALTLT